MSVLTLTNDQQAAYESFVAFIIDPIATVFVLEGFAGTGKSTLVNKFLDDLDSTLQMAQMFSEDKTEREWSVQLTATTNKACEALSEITHRPVCTIQSFLGLIVRTDYKTNTSTLVLKNGTEPQTDCIIFIDEASYADKALLTFIQELCVRCKIIYIGDPAQLAPVNSTVTPVFNSGYQGAKLEEVVRQAKENPIINLATNFRETVKTGEWSSFSADNEHIIHLTSQQFNTRIHEEFSDPAWKHDTSKVLAWMNKTVIGYNKFIRGVVEGVPHLETGDQAVVNQYIQLSGGKFKTDQLVTITSIRPHTEYGLQGWKVGIDNLAEAFMPASLTEKSALIKEAKKANNYKLLQQIDTSWIDLRAAYACTINKSQGSTYDRVFIDLDDIGLCRNGNTMARMLYVAVSRARHQVFFKGDLV